MTNGGSTLDNILKKAGSFSEQIGKVHSLSNQLKGEREALAEKEASFENDLLALVDTLYSFQQETISTLSELHAKLQSKADAEKQVKQKVVEPAEFEVAAEPEKKVKPKEVKVKQQEATEETTDFEVAIEPKQPEKPAKAVKPKPKAQKEKKAASGGGKAGEEEVYLFDL